MNKQSLSGSGLGTNSYGITTVIGRVDKYNQLREERLKMVFY